MCEGSEAINLTAFDAQLPLNAHAADASALERPRRIRVETGDRGRLISIEPAWRDLVTRALEPNVFMDPGFVQAAMLAEPKHKFAVLLAWDGDSTDGRLVGVWSFAVVRTLLPVRVLQAPTGPHAYLATPVLDRTVAEAALDAMLDAVEANSDWPDILSLTPMRADGATMAILRRIAAARQSRLRVFGLSKRPILQAEADGQPHLAATLSSASRKKLRQHRRRLAERGRLAVRTHLSAADVSAAFEDFLQLESAGWKGRRGDALNRSPSTAAFARGMIKALAQRGDAWIYALTLDDRPVSLQIILRCGAAAFTWKTAYDEKLRDFSPGMLLLEDFTTALLNDPVIAFVDSCAFDDRGYMAVWREREALADIWIDARRGGSSVFAVCARGQDILLRTRGLLKRVYGIGKRTWKRSSP